MSKSIRPQAALDNLEVPTLNWKILGQVAVGVLVLWVLAAMASSWIGIWGYVVAGLLTAVVIGFGIYAWRMLRNSSQIVEILKGATDADGRKAAIAALSDKGPSDVMAAVAQAQLVAQEDPKAALTILEAIDLQKAPKVLQNDVRAQMSLLYLVQGRLAEARPLCDAIDLDQQGHIKQKALSAAVVSECWARTGSHEAAAKLLEGFDADNPEFAEVAPLLWRAQIFTWVKVKKMGRARTAMMRLARIDPNQLAPFVQKNAAPDLKKLAMEVLQREGVVPKSPQVRFQR